MKIDEIGMLTADLRAMQEFYRNRLGLPVVRKDDKTLQVGAGASTLLFSQAPEGWAGCYHFAFNIPENRFKEAKEWAAQRATLLKSSSGEDEFNFRSWDAHSLYFYDPAGNILELIARHALAETATPTQFSANSILSVSEIGLVTEDVLLQVGLLTAELGVEVYDGEGSDTFAAVGDEEGLLIVVKRGRTWFPDTGKAADSSPLSLAVTTRRGRYRLSGPPFGKLERYDHA